MSANRLMYVLTARVATLIAFLLLSGSASAQFTGNIQGTVEDPAAPPSRKRRSPSSIWPRRPRRAPPRMRPAASGS